MEIENKKQSELRTIQYVSTTFFPTLLFPTVPSWTIILPYCFPFHKFEEWISRSDCFSSKRKKNYLKLLRGMKSHNNKSKNYSWIDFNNFLLPNPMLFTQRFDPHIALLSAALLKSLFITILISLFYYTELLVLEHYDK
jgi:hypothetical protein